MNIHPDTVIRLTVSVADADKILAALGALPFVQVADLIMSVRGQATLQLDQMQPAEEPLRPDGNPYSKVVLHADDPAPEVAPVPYPSL